MNNGKYVFAQFISLINYYEFSKSVEKLKGDYQTRTFSFWEQFLCMIYGQLTNQASLRSIVLCLSAHRNKLYHLGFKSLIKRSTFAEANENRNWLIYQEFANILIKKAVVLYNDDSDFLLDLSNSIYALDSTTIDLCLSVFEWAKFRTNKGAVRLHTLLSLRGSIPVFIHITDGKVHDVNVLDILVFEVDAIYVFDRGYTDFKRFYKIHLSKAFFVTRLKKNITYNRLYSNPVDKSKGLLFDQIIVLIGAKNDYPEKLRLIKYKDKETGKKYLFVTNNFNIDAFTIAQLYKHRWRIELFFKWIKQHLKIKVFWGTSENAVKTQIWIAMITYLIIAIFAKTNKIKHLSLNEIKQIISASAFDKTPILELLNFEVEERNSKTISKVKQLTLW